MQTRLTYRHHEFFRAALPCIVAGHVKEKNVPPENETNALVTLCLSAADHVPGRDSARTARDKSKERIAQIIAKAVSERLRAKPAWAATAEVILHITERMLGICPSAEMGPSIDRKTDAHRQRSVKCGTYSTPDFIADGMSRDLLQALESNRHARIDVADLSLEAGHFALSLLSQLPSRSVRFFGIDRDAAALQLAERILTFALDRSGCGLFKFHTARLDSICDRLPERWPRRFDAVIGNPPWKTRHPTDSPLLRRLLHPFLSGNFDLSLAFILRAHELLKPHGLLSMVLPSGFLFNQNAEMVRSLLLDEYDILKLSIYPRRSFIEIPCLAPVSFLARKHPSARLRRSHTAICYIHDKIGHSKRKREPKLAEERRNPTQPGDDAGLGTARGGAGQSNPARRRCEHSRRSH